jgi:hypothetical protein
MLIRSRAQPPNARASRRLLVRAPIKRPTV